MYWFAIGRFGDILFEARNGLLFDQLIRSSGKPRKISVLRRTFFIAIIFPEKVIFYRVAPKIRLDKLRSLQPVFG